MPARKQERIKLLTDSTIHQFGYRNTSLNVLFQNCMSNSFAVIVLSYIHECHNSWSSPNFAVETHKNITDFKKIEILQVTE